MERFLILLTLPILACMGLAEPVAPTITPLSPATVVPSTQTESQPQTDSPTTPATETSIPNVSQFPNTNDYEWRLIANGLTRPVDLQSAFDGSGRLFIIEKYGTIRIYENGQLSEIPFLNITDRVGSNSNEQGLLGLAFHPLYKENGRFFVNYTDKNGNTVIADFRVSADSNIADPSSERQLLYITQPYPNHNGGGLAIGPDHYLYIALGDGGSAGDPMGNGQNLNTLLGKVLRIEPFGGEGQTYDTVGNPFTNGEGLPEIWAYGLRNPWRISFDRATGDLWIGDVGQNEWEEIDYLPAGSPGGANFGWSIMEGNHGYDGSPQPGLLLPVAEYSHDEGGCSVTGGYVYRGAMPEWNGIYLYGDYCSGIIWGVILSNGGWQTQRLFEAGVLITSFGQDESGEIYLTADSGEVYILAKK